MYLISLTEESKTRNRKEAINRGCKSTLYWWGVVGESGDSSALDVGDGNGLSEAELSQCVSEMPKDFE